MSVSAATHPVSASAHQNRWTTAAFSEPADTSPMELDALGQHYDHCQCNRGRWFSLRCMVEALHGSVAPRFVTTLVVATLLIGVGAFAL